MFQYADDDKVIKKQWSQLFVKILWCARPQKAPYTQSPLKLKADHRVLRAPLKSQIRPCVPRATSESHCGSVGRSDVLARSSHCTPEWIELKGVGKRDSGFAPRM
jgi:hypothetical protein